MSSQPERKPQPAPLAFDDVGTGVPVMFVHGLTFSRATWLPVVEALQDSMRCISIDLPGHGESGGEPALLERCAELVHECVVALDVDRPVMIGHSMGAAIAMMYAARFPVRAVVDVDQTPFMLPFAGMLRQIEPALRGPDFEAAFAPIRHSIGVDALPEPMRSATLATQRIDRELVLGYWSEVFTSEPQTLQARVDADMANIRVPVLYVAGQTLPDADREHLRQHLPQTRLEEWPGSGHMVHLAQRDRFADTVRAFVGSVAT